MKHLQLPCAIFTAVLALSALAGCGESADPLHTVRTAATHTLGLTAQSTLTLTGTQLFGGSPGPIIGRGEFSFTRGLGYLALQLPAAAQRQAGTAYLVYLPAKLWTKPVASTGLPQGDLWIAAPFADARAAGSTTPSLALELESMNPQLLLEEIAAGAVSARAAGHRVVRHLPLAQYDVSVDLARALETAKSPALRVAVQQQLAALKGAQGGSVIHVVARVDGQGRIAQVQASPPGSKLGSAQIELWKFGGVIPLSLPLTSETVDLAALRRSRGAVTPAWMLTG